MLNIDLHIAMLGLSSYRSHNPELGTVTDSIPSPSSGDLRAHIYCKRRTLPSLHVRNSTHHNNMFIFASQCASLTRDAEYAA